MWRYFTLCIQALADILRSALCCHSNETRTPIAPIANPPNSVQLQGTPYHTPTCIHVACRCSYRMCECGEDSRYRQIHVTQTHRRPWVTSIHFASATPQAKILEIIFHGEMWLLKLSLRTSQFKTVCKDDDSAQHTNETAIRRGIKKKKKKKETGQKYNVRICYAGLP